MRRVNCRRCGIVAVEEVPGGDGKRTLTKAYLLSFPRWARRLSWKETAEAFRTSWDKLFDAVEHVVTFRLEHRVPGQIDAIGVDEIQYAKGHKYLRPQLAFADGTTTSNDFISTIARLCSRLKARLLRAGSRHVQQSMTPPCLSHSRSSPERAYARFGKPFSSDG